MAYHYNTRARARSDVEPDDTDQGDLDVEMTAAIVSESTNVGYQVESVEGLESQPTDPKLPCPPTEEWPPSGRSWVWVVTDSALLTIVRV